jgi:hypothetical protein
MPLTPWQLAHVAICGGAAAMPFPMEMGLTRRAILMTANLDDLGRRIRIDDLLYL